MSERLTEAQFSMQCSFIAKNASAWAGDILTLPEHYNEPARPATVGRSTDEMRERLDRLDTWAGRTPPQSNGAASTITAAPASAAPVGWQPIETAPKGEPKPYGVGPEILGVVVGDGWTARQIVQWEYHRNPARGSWKGRNGVWTPQKWMPLPAPPSTPTNPPTGT